MRFADLRLVIVFFRSLRTGLDQAPVGAHTLHHSSYVPYASSTK